MQLSCQVYAPAALRVGKETPFSIAYKAVGNQNQTGRFREEKCHLLVPGIEALLP